MSAGQEPTAGRAVHYVSYSPEGGGQASECRAAVVTAVSGRAGGNWVVSLAVLNPASLAFAAGSVQSEGDRRAGTWHWPERVP